jgi:hypothetical protein
LDLPPDLDLSLPTPSVAEPATPSDAGPFGPPPEAVNPLRGGPIPSASPPNRRAFPVWIAAAVSVALCAGVVGLAVWLRGPKSPFGPKGIAEGIALRPTDGSS